MRWKVKSQSPRRSFKYSNQDGKWFFEINSSSLAVLQSCQRKSHYLFDLGFESKASAAADYGTLMHEALAAWYTLVPSTRSSSKDLLVERWNEVFDDSGFIPPDEKRTKETGQKVLSDYFTAYKDDRWEVLLDEKGEPFIEREFEFVLVDSPAVKVTWFGTIDSIVQNRETGEIAVMDHKTSSSVGKEFCSRWEVNHQLTGYIMGCRHAFGLPVRKAIINGIQIAKTRSNIVRIETSRDDDDMREFTETVLASLRQWIMSTEKQFYPLASGFTCSAFAGCQFFEVCSVKSSYREAVLASLKNKPMTDSEE